MPDTLSLDGLSAAAATALQPWAVELAKGIEASAQRLRRLAEEVPGGVRVSGTLTVPLDAALTEARGATLRLAEALEAQPKGKQRQADRSARSSFEWVVRRLREAEDTAGR